MAFFISAFHWWVNPLESREVMRSETSSFDLSPLTHRELRSLRYKNRKSSFYTGTERAGAKE